jgi:hypothetical protein
MVKNVILFDETIPLMDSTKIDPLTTGASSSRARRLEKEARKQPEGTGTGKY